MNPFFWFLVLIGMVAVWLELRGLFVSIGSQAADLIRDTKDILNSDEAVEENFEDENGGNET